MDGHHHSIQSVTVPASGLLRVVTASPSSWGKCQAGLPAMVSSTWPGPKKGKELAALEEANSQDDRSSEDVLVSPTFTMQPSLGTHDSRICPFMEIQDGGLRAMVGACDFTSSDLIFDLGCGMGKILHKMLETFPCHGVGVEVNSSLAKIAESHLQQYGSRARVVVDDVRNVDLSGATAVVSYFLSHSFNAEGSSLKEHLSKTMRPGSLVLNYTYPVPGWIGAHKNGVYRYTIGQHLDDSG